MILRAFFFHLQHSVGKQSAFRTLGTMSYSPGDARRDTGGTPKRGEAGREMKSPPSETKSQALMGLIDGKENKINEESGECQS